MNIQNLEQLESGMISKDMPQTWVSPYRARCKNLANIPSLMAHL